MIDDRNTHIYTLYSMIIEYLLLEGLDLKIMLKILLVIAILSIQ